MDEFNKYDYDDDPRDSIGPYVIDKNHNIVVGGVLMSEPVTICESGDELSYKDAMDKAVELAIEKEAYGFFYQAHMNGEQIVGFY